MTAVSTEPRPAESGAAPPAARDDARHGHRGGRGHDLNPHQARVRLLARVMLTAQALWVAWACFRGFFFNDDIVFMGKGAVYPWLDPDYLFQPWGGHLMPAAFAVAQVPAKLSNYQYAWVALSLAVGQAFVAFLVYRTLRYLVGLRYRLLPLLLVYLISIPILQATVWWAAALNALPYVACMAIAVRFFVAFLLEHRVYQAAWTIGATAAGMLFFEKALLLLPLLGMVAITLAPRDRLLPALWWAIRRGLWVWVGLLAAAGGWLFAYFRSPTSDQLGSFQPDIVSDQFVQGLIQTFIPSLVGGPWTFRFTPELTLGTGYSPGSAPTWAALACLVLALLVAAGLAGRGYRARRALATLAVYALVVLVSLNLGRSVFLGATSSLPRYYADLTLVTVLMLALSVARLRPDPDRPGLREPTVPRRLRVPAAVTGIVLANAMVASTVLAGLHLVEGLDVPAVRVYISRATDGLARLGPGAEVLNGTVDNRIISPVLAPFNTYDWVFAPVHGGPSFPDQTDGLTVIDDFGTVQPGYVSGPASIPGKTAGCGYRIREEATPIRLNAPVIVWYHTVRVQYLSSAATTATLRLGGAGEPVTVTLRAGLNDLYVNAEGGGRFVFLSDVDPTVTVCVDRVVVGRTVPGQEFRLLPDSPSVGGYIPELGPAATPSPSASAKPSKPARPSASAKPSAKPSGTASPSPSRTPSPSPTGSS